MRGRRQIQILLQVAVRDKALLLLVGAYLVDLLYTLVEWDFNTKYSFFPFFHGYSGWDGKMALGSYVYYYCQHVCLMMIFYALYLFSAWRFVLILFWVEVADLIDYMCFYHEAWFKMPGFWKFESIPFEFNYIKVLFITIYAYIEWRR